MAKKLNLKPTFADDAASGENVSAQRFDDIYDAFLALMNQKMTEVQPKLLGTADAGGNKIIGSANPTQNTDAATLEYYDSIAAQTIYSAYRGLVHGSIRTSTRTVNELPPILIPLDGAGYDLTSEIGIMLDTLPPSVKSAAGISLKGGYDGQIFVPNLYGHYPAVWDTQWSDNSSGTAGTGDTRYGTGGAMAGPWIAAHDHENIAKATIGNWDTPFDPNGVPAIWNRATSDPVQWGRVAYQKEWTSDTLLGTAGSGTIPQGDTNEALSKNFTPVICLLPEKLIDAIRLIGG